MNEQLLPERPDLTDLSPDVIMYIEALETKITTLTASTKRGRVKRQDADLPAEPPTTLNLLTLTVAGIAKRTSRHLYNRQKRGGMGVFDLEADKNDPPALLTIADERDTVLIFTNQGRAFRMAVNSLPSTEVRAKGEDLKGVLPFRTGERLVAVLPEDAGIYVALISERGWVKRVRNAYLTSRMLQGTTFHNVSEGGYLAGACWTTGKEQLFIGTSNGLAIRFDEAQIPTRGCLGIRVAPDDKAIGVAPTNDSAGIFLMSADGKGTVRLMTGFRKNKAPGAGGKVAIKTKKLAGIATVEMKDDLFVISQQGKLIRFAVGDVPAKTGVVQGVNCMSLRVGQVAGIVPATLEAE